MDQKIPNACLVNLIDSSTMLLVWKNVQKANGKILKRTPVNSVINYVIHVMDQKTTLVKAVIQEDS